MSRRLATFNGTAVATVNRFLVDRGLVDYANKNPRSAKTADRDYHSSLLRHAERNIEPPAQIPRQQFRLCRKLVDRVHRRVFYLFNADH